MSKNDEVDVMIFWTNADSHINEIIPSYFVSKNQ